MADFPVEECGIFQWLEGLEAKKFLRNWLAGGTSALYKDWEPVPVWGVPVSTVQALETYRWDWWAIEHGAFTADFPH